MPEICKKTKVYTADAGILKNEYLYESAYRSVSDARREKTDKLLHDSDKRLSVGAEVLLRYALKRAGVSVIPEAFEIGEYGKPYLKDRTLSFNLSHSGEYVLCTVSGDSVGCDIEREGPIDLKIAGKFHPEEFKAILSEEDDARRLALFYRYWTLKESYLKARGVGMSLPLDAFCITLGERICCRPDADRFRFREFSEIPGYRIAVCTEGEPEDTKIEQVDFTVLLREKGI